MLYHVRHETAYVYGSDVVHSHQLLHLVPRPSPFQECLDHSIRINPAGYQRRDETDAFGNIATRIELENAHRRLDVMAELHVDVHARPAVAVSAVARRRVPAQVRDGRAVPLRDLPDGLALIGLDELAVELERDLLGHIQPLAQPVPLFVRFALAPI